jgi:hypothetical protein
MERKKLEIDDLSRFGASLTNEFEDIVFSQRFYDLVLLC